VSTARAHIDLSSLADNWRMLARRAAPAQAAAVVKANGYGLGADRIGQTLAEAGARRFYVAWPDEGAGLRATLGPGPEIAVFHGFDPQSLPLLVQARLEPVINTLDQLALWLGPGLPSPYAIHLDTGMNRLGLPAAQWALAERLSATKPPSHVVSHLACPDEPAHPMNEQQLSRFQAAAPLWPSARRSLAATAGVYLGPRFHFDEVRPGIGLYGGGPTPLEGPAPRPVLRLTAPVLQVRDVEPGETTGYGGSWTAARLSRLATLGTGYADGFLRSASNRGYGVIRGERRPIIGRISMDLLMLDVTGLDVAVGEDVELIGPALLIADQADAMSTIDYEILTRLGQRARRIYSGPA
jgi:alanine racemase